jgi:hypothetical protein
MPEGLSSVIEKLPQEVNTFLDINNNLRDLIAGKYVSLSTRRDALDKLIANIFHDMVMKRDFTSPNVHEYINNVLIYEYERRKIEMLDIELISSPSKIILKYSPHNGFFSRKEVKECYENKENKNKILSCKLSDFVYVEKDEDSLYIGRKI